MNRTDDGSHNNPKKDESMVEEVQSIDRMKAWAARIKDSDRDAFAAVFQSMSAKLVRYAQTITRDKASAYDILQDVFLKLWEIRERIDPDSSLQSLLYTMTRNAAINFSRKQSALRHNNTENEEYFDHLYDETRPTIDAMFEARNLNERISWWIDELPERRKEAFILSRHHDLTHREISKIMGLSERTVNTHIFLALKHLRARLDALNDDA